MIYYEVKLIHPETKEVFFHVTAPKPQLPSKEILERHREAVIVIRTNPRATETAPDQRK